jgi:hypothetical protein
LECGDLSPLWFAAEPLSFDYSVADQREAARQKKGRSATEESGDESPHSKGWRRHAAGLQEDL